MADPKRAAAAADRGRARGKTARANELARKKAAGEATAEELAELAALVAERKGR